MKDADKRCKKWFAGVKWESRSQERGRERETWAKMCQRRLKLDVRWKRIVVSSQWLSPHHVADDKLHRLTRRRRFKELTTHRLAICGSARRRDGQGKWCIAIGFITARDAMLPRYMLSSCVRPSGLSVCYKSSGFGSLECFIIIKCTKFCLLILRKIIKIFATRCQILRLKYTKSFVGWVSAQTPLGELTALPSFPSWILGGGATSEKWRG